MSIQLVTTPLRARGAAAVAACGRRGPAAPRGGGAYPSGTPDPRARLLEPGALVVTTGQQPGLFTGPLYTIYKAISVAALARQLEARWQRTGRARVLARDRRPRLRRGESRGVAGARRHASARTLRERAADALMSPMYREPLGAEIATALAALKADLAGRRVRRRDAWPGSSVTIARRRPSAARTPVRSPNWSHRSAWSASTPAVARSSSSPPRS